MKDIPVYDDPTLALVKSVAAEAVANGSAGTPHPIPVDHPLLHGVDRYCQAMLDGQTPPVPDPGADETDPDVVAYLVYLHHHKAHARVADDPALEAQIDAQLEQFTYGKPGWQAMFDQYVKYYWAYPHHAGGTPTYRSWQDPAYGAGDPQYGAIHWRIPANATVALIGDIGTGTDVAAAVLLGALSFKPDVILHLGDVYYSGTTFEFAHYYTGLIEAVFADQGVDIPVYTLPGNHEYFTGAVPYLAALDEGRFTRGPGQRQQTSYFSLRSADDGWQFLGMDTSFHGHYMGVKAEKLDAALRALHVPPDQASDPDTPPDMVFVRPDEVAWHRRQLADFAGRTVLLSHHQLYSANQTVGVAQRTVDGAKDPTDRNRKGVNTRLWEAFGDGFGDPIAAWFWGHEHNLGIFQNGYCPPGWLAAESGPWKPVPFGRCVGHSAIPVATTELPYQVNNPVPLERPDLTLGTVDGWYNRGFQILQLAGKGRPIETSYYQVRGVDPTPVQIYHESIP